MHSSPEKVDEVRGFEKVIGLYWPDEYSLIGPESRIFDLDDIADQLAASSFMRAWIAERIREALRSGEIIHNVGRVTDKWRGRDDGVKAEYRVATQDEVIKVAETERYSDVTGRTMSRRSQEKSFIVHYLDSDSIRDAYEKLPKQAQRIMDLVNGSGRDEVTEAGLLVILAERAGELSSRQEPMKIFQYYRKRLTDEGHLEEVGDD